MSAIRVVLADDHPVVRAGIKYELQAAGIAVVGEARDGREALALVRTLQPDVLVLDVRMPHLSGIEVVQTLRAEQASRYPAIVALSAMENEAAVLALLTAGVLGYILKDEMPETIVAAVEAAAAGKSLISPTILARMSGLLTSDDPSGTLLSLREREVLCLLAQGKSNQEIGDLLMVATQTVKNHVSAIYVKLKVDSRVAAAVRAISLGLITVEEIEDQR